MNRKCIAPQSMCRPIKIRQLHEISDLAAAWRRCTCGSSTPRSTNQSEQFAASLHTFFAVVVFRRSARFAAIFGCLGRRSGQQSFEVSVSQHPVSIATIAHILSSSLYQRILQISTSRNPAALSCLIALRHTCALAAQTIKRYGCYTERACQRQGKWSALMTIHDPTCNQLCLTAACRRLLSLIGSAQLHSH